ncbi:hypothetical protein AB3R30_19945 [Leptolyngbyaceae cyanobacterium UHCC 1019]
MWEVIKLKAKQPINVQAIAEAKTMNNSNDSSQIVNIGGDVSGSTINLGSISGSVTNAISQLPDRRLAFPDQPNLKELLTQLQQAIETDTDLPTKGKESALEQVKLLAEVAQNPDQPEKKGLGTQAITFLKGAISFLPDTAKLADACSKLLPLITKLLGI